MSSTEHYIIKICLYFTNRTQKYPWGRNWLLLVTYHARGTPSIWV